MFENIDISNLNQKKFKDKFALFIYFKIAGIL